jgi:(S)-citramalyl-CoA lyase
MLLVSSSAKKDARATALRYLAQIPADHLPCALRINSPETKFGLNDLQDLLNSPAEPDYLVLPKCNSAALIRLVGNLLREAKKATQIIGLIESAKAIEALEEIVTARSSQLPWSSARRIWQATLGQTLLGNRCFM